jgi:very-short-patch-repair endonuclease
VTDDEGMRTPPRLPPPLIGVPFTRQDARRHGIDDLRLRARDIHHPFHGVNLSRQPGDVRELCSAYLAVMPKDAHFSHSTAAALLGIPLPPSVSPYPLHVSVLAPRTAPTGRGIHGHSLASLAGTVIEGLPISAPAHVWCQLSGEVGRDDLVAAGDHLIGARLRTGLVTIEDLATLSARLQRTKGGRSRSWALPRIRMGVDSRPETYLRLFLEELGWEGVEVNKPVAVDGGRLALHPDLSVPSERVAFEYEGDGHRVDRRQWRLDIERRELLEAAGWRVVRVTAHDLFARPDAFLARLQRFAPNRGYASAKTANWRKS